MKTRKKAKVPWYSEEAGFFGEGYLKEYVAFTSAKPTEHDIAFVIKVLGLKKGTHILDLACGHGRHAIELAKRGFRVTGLDLNRFFLQEGKKAARKAGVTVQWMHSDMRRIPFEDAFDVVLSLFTSFGYLENDDEDQKVLHAVTKALRPKGKFLIDVRSPHQLMKIYNERDWAKLPDGSLVLREQHFSTVLGRNEELRTRLWKSGKREECPILCRMYTIPELVRMGKIAGLHFLKAYGDGEEAHTINSKRMVLVFEKK